MVPGAYARNVGAERKPGSGLLSSLGVMIADNDATTVTYAYYGGGDRGAAACFNTGDAFSVRKCDRARSKWTR